ncbi:hypothetical protein H8356DRAFT_1337207 [Neocallimastix lanati (nom. inval.)]|nr:hypothetical protein H8356DRAFT_1337207 [Neocallimastix sp. JGI-2020a]
MDKYKNHNRYEMGNKINSYSISKHRSSQFVRVVKESDLKSGGLCPRRGVSSALEQLTADQ